MNNYLAYFVGLWLYRYTRLIINCISHWTFQPKPIPLKPTFSGQDVTIVIPTLDGDSDDLREMLPTCLRTEPDQIILATIDANYKKAARLAESYNSTKITVCSVLQANKRLQTCEALERVNTEITILADDDVIWPLQIVQWMLAPFEDAAIGGVGTCQRLRRAENPTLSQRFWNFLGAIYLERRNFDISACSHIDGGVPCMSGRTVAYRTQILRDPEFMSGFKKEKWRNCILNADDDNFVTRWLYSHNWKTYIQYHKSCELQTTLENNSDFLKQCLRWSRSNWRSNITSMWSERIWRKQPWSTYAVHLTTITAWALPTDLLLVFLCIKASENWPTADKQAFISALLVWMFISKWIKLLGHYIRYPVDIVFLPVSILFGYFHGVVKLYAFVTLQSTTWGSRPNADTDDQLRMIRQSGRNSWDNLEKCSEKCAHQHLIPSLPTQRVVRPIC